MCLDKKKIDNTKIDNAKDTDIVMSMYNLIEYSDNYSKTLRSLWQRYRGEPVLTILAFLIIFLVIVLGLIINKK